jgi:predicted dehydrogenase
MEGARKEGIGVAVVGAGMAGRAHAAAYRSATTVFGGSLPEIRLVAIADSDAKLAEDVRRRYGYERAVPSWQAIAEARDIGAVSVAVANSLHREVVEGLLSSGKHVLCEKPLASSLEDAEAMVAAADRSGVVAAVGFSYRRSPSVSAIRREVSSGRMGEVLCFSGRYWCDYALDPRVPMSWRYRGGPGTGSLADLGAHLVDMAELVCGLLAEVSGAVFATVMTERPVPARSPTGHELAELTGEVAFVENEDIATFTARFREGGVATFSISRVAHGLPNGLGFEVFCSKGAAAFDMHRPAEFLISDAAPPPAVNGYRRVITGPEHPYVRGGLSMDAAGTSHGVGDFFTYQARAFLDQVVGGEGLEPCASFHAGLHNMRVLEAVCASAAAGGTAQKVE